MIITGCFHVLHPVNTAWALIAKQSAQKNNQSLTIKLKNNPLYSFETVTSFLNAFKLADNYLPVSPQDDNNLNCPALPTLAKAKKIIEMFWASKVKNTIFKSPESFFPVLHELKKKNVSLVTTNGCFDILHPGHVDILKQPDKQNYRLVVLINSNRSIKALKGSNRPVHDWFFRASLLSELRAVDYVVVFDNDTPLKALKVIQPVCHIKGGSFVKKRVEAEQNLLNQWNGKVQFTPMVDNFSTTRILETYPDRQFPV